MPLNTYDPPAPATAGRAVTPTDAERIRDRAQFIREETIRLISIAKVGHYASVFSCAELLAALYYDVLRIRPDEPDWPDRDRFLFGKGHAAVGQYPVLADLGYFPPALLDDYTRLGSPFGDHPDMRRVLGCDFSSGSLGHALSTGVGMALAARIRSRDYRVFVMLGDGELHEGQIWEAAMAAGHRSLHNLVAIVDRNEHCLDGRVDDIVSLEPLDERWRAFGWHVTEVDGHDPTAVLGALRQLVDDHERTAPAVLIAHTVKGKGVSFMESEIGWHLGYLAEPDEQFALAQVRGEL
jgi:transketolase